MTFLNCANGFGAAWKEKGAYTGNAHWKVITYILDDEEYLYEGFVCLGVSPIVEPQEAEHE